VHSIGVILSSQYENVFYMVITNGILMINITSIASTMIMLCIDCLAISLVIISSFVFTQIETYIRTKDIFCISMFSQVIGQYGKKFLSTYFIKILVLGIQ